MPPVETLLRLRVLILGWLITWVATVPLFHTHVPDTTDDWSALKSGGAHTVFTPDLPGEFSHPIREKHFDHSGQLSQRVVNSPELGIAVFDDPEDRKAKRLHVLGVPFRFPDTPLPSSAVFPFSEKCCHPQVFQAFPASRAPPHVV